MEELQAVVDKVWIRVIELVDALEELEARLGCRTKKTDS